MKKNQLTDLFDSIKSSIKLILVSILIIIVQSSHSFLSMLKYMKYISDTMYGGLGFVLLGLYIFLMSGLYYYLANEIFIHASSLNEYISNCKKFFFTYLITTIKLLGLAIPLIIVYSVYFAIRGIPIELRDTTIEDNIIRWSLFTVFQYITIYTIPLIYIKEFNQNVVRKSIKFTLLHIKNNLILIILVLLDLFLMLTLQLPSLQYSFDSNTYWYYTFARDILTYYIGIIIFLYAIKNIKRHKENFQNPPTKQLGKDALLPSAGKLLKDVSLKKKSVISKSKPFKLSKGWLSFIFGGLALLFFGLWTGIPAIILGILALRDIKHGKSDNKILATVGLIAGVIRIVISFGTYQDASGSGNSGSSSNRSASQKIYMLSEKLSCDASVMKSKFRGKILSAIKNKIKANTQTKSIYIYNVRDKGNYLKFNYKIHLMYIDEPIEVEDSRVSKY